MSTATVEKTSDAASEAAGNKPVQVFRHRQLSASIFENEAKNGGTFYSVSLQRAYKDGDEYRHSSSFSRDEIPVARHLLQNAWAFILEAQAGVELAFEEERFST